jgi:hypothetical protein
VLANYRCTPYPEALATWMREKATELGRFADYVYRQPSAEGELFTVRTATVGRHELLSCLLTVARWSQDYLNKFTSYSFLTEMGSMHRPPYADAITECIRCAPSPLHPSLSRARSSLSFHTMS